MFGSPEQHLVQSPAVRRPELLHEDGLCELGLRLQPLLKFHVARLLLHQLRLRFSQLCLKFFDSRPLHVVRASTHCLRRPLFAGSPRERATVSLRAFLLFPLTKIGFLN